MINENGFIGICYLGDVIQESIGTTNLNKWGKCIIRIKGSEGSIPHMHIESTDGKSKCCVCLFEPKYFNHEPGQIEMGKKEAKDLDKFLRTKNPDSGKTYWEEEKILWSRYKDPDDKTWEHYDDWQDMKQPNYAELSDNRYTGKGKGYASKRR